MTTTIESRSPQNPKDLVVEVAEVEPEGVAAAAATAWSAQRDWWSAAPAVRSAALRALAEAIRTRADEAAALVVREVGKPIGEAKGEVARAIAICDYYAQAAYEPVGETYPAAGSGMLYTERRPYGVAGLITPWNFPLAIPLWKSAPALAAGNGVLLKPSPDAVACGAWLGELFAQVLPSGLAQVLPGGAETGAALVDHADVVSFTGSATVGRSVAVAATQRGVPVQAEMGGQNAAIVLPDADVEATAATVAGASMAFAGQKCTATRRVVVVGDEARFDAVRDALVGAVGSLTVGDPAAPDVTVGPLINERALEAMRVARSAVDAAGGRVLAGAGDSAREGWFADPVLVDGIAHGHQLVTEETFAPFAVLQPAADIDEAVRTAEAVRYGLVTSVHGRDIGALLDVASRIDTGLVKINAPTTGVDFYAPFGGERDSSIGPREQGKAALSFYASTRTVTVGP